MIVYTYEVVATYTSCVGGGYSRSYPILYVNPTGESFTGLFLKWSSQKGVAKGGSSRGSYPTGEHVFYSVGLSSKPSRRRGSTKLEPLTSETCNIYIDYTYLRRVQCIYPSLDIATPVYSMRLYK